MDPTFTDNIPYYLDWSFWAVIVAATAIALSQLPPIRMWFKRPTIEIDVHTRIVITHKLGNPNAQLYVIVTNIGGRAVRIKNITLDFKRDKANLFSLPVQNYYQTSIDKEAILFTPLSLGPNAEWSHLANFLHFFDRTDERRYRDAESNLRQDIYDKRRGITDPNELISADFDLVRPLTDFFNEKFDWHPGGYEVTVKVEADKTTASRRYLFPIFESESEELRSITDGYKYGAGVYWNPEGLPMATIGIQLNEPDA